MLVLANGCFNGFRFVTGAGVGVGGGVGNGISIGEGGNFGVGTGVGIIIGSGVATGAGSEAGEGGMAPLLLNVVCPLTVFATKPCPQPEKIR